MIVQFPRERRRKTRRRRWSRKRGEFLPFLVGRDSPQGVYVSIENLHLPEMISIFALSHGVSRALVAKLYPSFSFYLPSFFLFFTISFFFIFPFSKFYPQNSVG
jgi:hypothetical protein